MLYLNGEYFDRIEDGRVSVEDRGFQFGDGVYEVVRVYGGKPFRLAQHLKRLEGSLDGLRIPLPEPVSKIEEVCRRLIAGTSNASLYLQVTRGAAPRVHTFPKDLRPTFVAYVRAIQGYPDDKVFRLAVVRDERWNRCNLKTVALLANVLARQAAVDAGADEGLFVREDGTVTEGTSSNAFLVSGGRVVTHPANHRILDGVTRLAVLQVARDAGLPVDERPFTLQEARAADEFFMTGTVTEVMPAVQIDGRPVGRGTAGPVTLRLRDAFRELVRRECT
ncbi:MAG TPA: D-amino acid aminotransferase [Planctomycetota bacterium]|nr:D-amino acid aminotransferase [Planctomycetota bacterium]